MGTGRRRQRRDQDAGSVIEDDVIYLSPMSGPNRDRRHPDVGWIVTPESDRGVAAAIKWAADCGLAVARSTDRADIERYIDWLETSPHDRSMCLYATAPDVLGDAAATWERSAPLLPLIRGLGYRAALVAQDGFDLEAVDWDAFDVLFIGGKPLVTKETAPSERRRLRAQEWKRSDQGGYAAIAEGKRRGKWVHVGRVNGGPFLTNAASAGADSADGSILCHGPERHWPLVCGWLDGLNSQPPMLLEALS
jgi:hypothetical protein